MKKNSLGFAYFLVIILMALSLHSTAQLFTRQLPKSWTAKADGIERRTWFHLANLKPGSKSKDKIFQDKIQTADYPHLFYPIEAVKDLLTQFEKIATPYNSVNVYITLFTNSANCKTALPPISPKQIILVFAPANRTPGGVTDIGKYFMIAPDNKCYEVEKPCMEDWSLNYFKKVVDGADGLISTILNAPENIGKDGKLTDTKSIVYPYENFKEFLTREKDYQNRKFYTVTGIQVDFSQFTDKGDGSINADYKYRLILQFEFTRKDENNKDVVFYIDDEKNFLRRLKKTRKKNESRLSSNGTVEIMTFNHGELCPQICN